MKDRSWIFFCLAMFQQRPLKIAIIDRLSARRSHLGDIERCYESALSSASTLFYYGVRTRKRRTESETACVAPVSTTCSADWWPDRKWHTGMRDTATMHLSTCTWSGLTLHRHPITTTLLLCNVCYLGKYYPRAFDSNPPSQEGCLRIMGK